MDDDLTFGTSVWGTSDPVPLSSHQQSIPNIPSLSLAQINSSDDFDDFGPSVQTAADENDEFGDFGEFGEFGDAQGEVTQDFPLDVFAKEVPRPGPLKLDPMPSRAELVKQVNDILRPIWGDVDISQVTSQEELRQVEGIGQILVTPESRNFYNALMEIPPLKPPNWKQSKIRRQHLIALGIPVNLDEVLPRANGKPLPPLQITTRPPSAPPVPKTGQHFNNPLDSSRAGTPRSGTPQGRHIASPFGPKPELDERKITEVLALESDTLTLLPIVTLESHLADIRAQIAQTSGLLKHLLQTRETLQQDSETYNKLIAELVGEAQKIKTGKSRSSGKRGG